VSSPNAHPPLPELSRFVDAGLPENGRFKLVRRHLAHGCDLCSGIIADLSREEELARFLRGMERPVINWIVPERILSDSSGLRAGALADIQLVCAAGPYEVDILVRGLEAPQALIVGGQVTRADLLLEPVEGLPVSLVDAQNMSPVAHATTDRFGEFTLACPREGQFGLRIGRSEDAPCILVWEGEPC